MALANYSDLKSSIADWLVRSDLTAVIPDFIRLAEAQMERVLRVRQMMNRATANLDTEYSLLPGDFLAVRTYKLEGSSPLEYVTSDWMDDQFVTTGEPRYYTIVGNQIRVYPSPDTTYVGELTYYQKLNRLSNTVTSNWLLESSPDAYIYGALLQAAPYLQDDARAPVWQGLYQSAIEALKSADVQSFGVLRTRTRPFGG